MNDRIPCNTHELKILPKWFEDVQANKKNFEIRKNDRNFEVGDYLILKVKLLEQERSRSAEITQYRHDCEKLMEENERLKKALEQQPCEDCISREDLKRKLQEEHDLYVNAYGGFSNLPLKEKARVDEITSCIAEVVNMPSVYSKLKTEHWIPVSERLPEFGQDVLLSLRSLDIKTGFRAETEPYFYCHGVDGCYIEPQNVLAWMPLPKPYNE